MVGSSPTLLIIDTSSQQAGVAIAHNNKLITEVSAAENSHSEELENLVRTVLQSANLELSQVKKILINSGPGSFTGLRIGYAFAAGLSKSTELPVVEIAGLTALAATLKLDQSTVIALRPAGRSEFFTEVFDCAGPVPKSFRAPVILSLAMVASLATDCSRLAPGRPVKYVADRVLPELAGRDCLPVTVQASLAGMFSIYRGSETPPVDILPAQVHTLEPLYIRAVQAKTIAERAENQ